MQHVSDEQVAAFVDASHQVAAEGLVRYGSGNMSRRLDGGLVLMTATRAWLGQLTNDQVALCRLDDGRVLNDVKPTVEINFHLEVLRRRPEMNVVLHFQSPYATLVACGPPLKTNFFVIPEAPHYVGPPGYVEYFTPGSDQLTQAVAAAAVEHHMIILRNHGVITMAQDYRGAIIRAGFFEMSCQVVLNRPQYTTITDQQAADLLNGGKV